MDKTNYAQFGFNRGELSPRMDMRDDIEARRLGMDYIENWIVHLQGPLETVHGFEFVEDSPGAYGRIFPFYVSTFSGFIILVTPEFVYVIDRNGFAILGNQVLNGDFLSGGTNWTVATVGGAVVEFSGGSCSLIPGGGTTFSCSITQNVTVVAAEPNRLVIQIASGAGPMLVSVGSTEGAGDIYPQTSFIGVDIIELPGLVSPDTNFWVECLVEGAQLTKIINKIECFNESVSVVPIKFASPWADTNGIAHIQTKMAPGTFDLFMTSTDVATQILSYDPGTGVWDLVPAPFTNTPLEWAAGNWPSAIVFLDGRLYLGGTTNEPEDFWATRPGKAVGWEKYRDWEIGENADHALQFTIEKKGKIRWMMASRNLVIGTENAEHIITAQDGVIIPGDVQSTIQSSYGSSNNPAIEIGNSILFVSPDGRKLRAMSYEWTKEAYATKDITFAAEHITGDGNTIGNIHYAANPYSLIFGATALGTSIGCSYDAENQQGGFFRRTTSGPFISMCVLPYGGVDEIWSLVDRDFEGPDLSLERSSYADNVKLDSHITLRSPTPTDTWIAAHLNGMTCQALVDGAVHPDIIVEADGSFKTQIEATSVSIGLGILSTARTMSLGTAVKYLGTSRPMLKKWSKLYARILGSWKPKINGRRPPTRHPATPMGEMEPPRTETVKVANLGWDLEGRILIEQDLPVPTEVAGIFGELSQEQL